MRYEKRSERIRIRAVRALLWPALLVASPVLLVAGAPIRRRYLRYIYRDGAPPVLDKERGHVSVHYLVATHPLFEWLGRE
ncbi:hypothetical protein ACFYUH_29550 [Streptomyces fimicarius]|uniref:hypothetical protein n=1 Tax=Streptomyces griseus TaxID=1911 RepID=UPI0036C01FDF